MSAFGNTFSALNIQGWRQFGSIDLNFHSRLTVITGANGAGKSSLLRILNQHFGLNRPFLATPIYKSDGAFDYKTGLFGGRLARTWARLVSSWREGNNNVGFIKYTNGAEAQLHVPDVAGVQYNPSLVNQQHVLGIVIDSHQPISPFQQVAQIPTNVVSADAAYQSYNNEINNKYQGGHTGYSPIYRMKESIISMAMFGEGNSKVQANPQVLLAYNGFVNALRHILPESLGFLDIAIRPPEVVLVTKSGEFLIDASSGGVMMLLDLTWRLHMFSLNQNNFVVCMDEPENHLHPTMQQSLLPNLLTAFPQAQFIIATHSPFMVSSVKDSNVYVLRYAKDEDGEASSELTTASRVYSERLDTVNKAGSANEILREVLGVSATMPKWVEGELESILSHYRDQPITSATLVNLRQELSSSGFDDFYPRALAVLTEKL